MQQNQAGATHSFTAMAENLSRPAMPCSETVVTLTFNDLATKSSDVSESLEAGFGPSGLGIIAIKDVPGYPQLRKKLLPLAQSLLGGVPFFEKFIKAFVVRSRVATLPEDVRRQLEDPPSRYSFGWSHGKEKLETGRPDQLKGSYYANLCKDTRTTSTELMQRNYKISKAKEVFCQGSQALHFQGLGTGPNVMCSWGVYPTQCRDNIWPTDHLAELEPAMKELGALIMEVGFLLAYHCDKYVASRTSTANIEPLERILRRSQCHKGRLLHYFPNFDSDKIVDVSSWCGWHRDIGSLTGLTCAIYTKEGVEVSCPDPEAGLYIENRAGIVVKAVYDANFLAFQMGETTEILSGGLFHATPHCVKAPRYEILGVERNSFAVFMQPQWDEPLIVPEIMGESLNKGQYSNLSNFGDFSESKLLKYNYDPAQTVEVAT